MKLLLYCTKAKPYLVQGLAKPMHTLDANNPYNFNWKVVKKGFSNDRLNGKIVAECDFEVEKIIWNKEIIGFETTTLTEAGLCRRSKLLPIHLSKYLKDKKGYAIHIKNLHIFDKPRELSEFYNIQDCGGMLFTHILKKAPQNIMRVSVNRWLYGEYTPNDVNILISIRPEWLCKILNGEKTIEVRKKVLKEML